MKLVGDLKKQVEETTTKEEAKEVIEKAGMELTDEELDCVTGGEDINGQCSKGGVHQKGIKYDPEIGKNVLYCTKCGVPLDCNIFSF